eukprot:UN02663
MTQYSLYAAASLGLSTNDILFGLERLCKNKVPDAIKDFIHLHTSKCGKVKLVLKNQRYYIETPYKHVLKTLVSDPFINNARCDYDLSTADGRQRKKRADEERLLNANNPALRAELQRQDGMDEIEYEYDPSTGFIVQLINPEDEEAIVLQGTGTIDQQGNRINAKVNQRAAMGILDGVKQEVDDDFAMTKKLGFNNGAFSSDSDSSSSSSSDNSDSDDDSSDSDDSDDE